MSAAGFHKALVRFGTNIALVAPFLAATDFVEDRLKLEWRNWLTGKLLRGYYGNRAFYRLHNEDSGVDNPDQARQKMLPPRLSKHAMCSPESCAFAAEDM